MPKLHTLLILVLVVLLSRDHLGVHSTTAEPESTVEPEPESTDEPEDDEVSIVVILAAFFYALLIVSITIILIVCVFCKCCPKLSDDEEALQATKKSDPKLDGIDNPGVKVQPDSNPL